MPARINLEGQRFGKLTVLHRSVRNPYRYWECRCECGKLTSARSDNLRTGHVKSCGCLTARDGPGYMWTEAEKGRLVELWGSMPRREIATTINRSPRAVTAMASRLHLKKPVRPEVATATPGRTPIPAPSEEEYDSVIRECAAWHEVPARKAYSGSRQPKVVLVRWDAWARLRSRGYTYQGIGLVSGFDHTSVLHSWQRRQMREAAE